MKSHHSNSIWPRNFLSPHLNEKTSAKPRSRYHGASVSLYRIYRFQCMSWYMCCFRAVGTPLEWPHAKKKAAQVREWGIEVRLHLDAWAIRSEGSSIRQQLLAIWQRAKGKERDALRWGDEAYKVAIRRLPQRLMKIAGRIPGDCLWWWVSEGETLTATSGYSWSPSERWSAVQARRVCARSPTGGKVNGFYIPNSVRY